MNGLHGFPPCGVRPHRFTYGWWDIWEKARRISTAVYSQAVQRIGSKSSRPQDSGDAA